MCVYILYQSKLEVVRTLFLLNRYYFYHTILFLIKYIVYNLRLFTLF